MDFTRFIFFKEDPFGDSCRMLEHYRGYGIEYNALAICVSSPNTRDWMHWDGLILGCHNLEQARQFIDWDIAQMQVGLLP